MPIVAIPDLTIVIGAVIALMFLLGLYLFERLLSNSIGRAPIIGGWVSSALSAAMRDTRNLMGSVLDGAMHGLTDSVHASIAFLENLYHIGYDATNALYWGVHRIWFVRLPAWIHWLEAVTATAIAKAESTAINYAKAIGADAATARHAISVQFDAWDHWLSDHMTALFSALESATAAAVKVLRGDIASAESTARAEISAARSALEAELAGKVAAAQAAAAALYRQAEADTATAAKAAEAYAAARASAALGAAVAAVDSTAATVGAAVWPGIVTDVQGLSGVIGQDLPAIRDLVDAIPRAVPGDLAAVIGGVAALAIPALKYMEECGIPNCRNLGGLGNFLQDLLGDATAAALIAWLALAVADPSAWGNETANALTGIGSDAMNAAKTLLGV